MNKNMHTTTQFKASSTPVQVRSKSDSAPTILRYLSDHLRTILGPSPDLRWMWMLIGAVLMATFSSCDDEPVTRQYTFNATMEQLQNADTYGTKVQLVNEEWTYWELYDSISLISNASVGNGASTLFTGWLVNGGGGDYSDYNGAFITTLEEQEGKSSRWFVGVHPANYQKHKITYSGTSNHGFTAKVYLEPVQHYRHDSSYARQVLPMIATYDGPAWGSGPGESGDPYRLDFHSLAGLVRLQLLNGTGNAVDIKKIELESLTPTGSGTDTIARKALAGLFNVKNLYNYNAHLDQSGVADAAYTLTLSTSASASEGSLAFEQNELKSFYVVLPAFHGMDTTTFYHLQMRVYTTDNKVCKKNFTVRTRRNGITYLRAINITEFDESDGTGNPVLVGNGTSTRPFKIYTVADLQYVRDRFNAGGEVRINGQVVTRDTWFRIMRSDIVLTDANWRAGINNFTGHMTYYSNAPHVTHGIVNRSYVPVFSSISADGEVKGLSIVTDSELDFNNLGTGTDYSPLCGTNNGRIEDCRNISPAGLEGNARRFVGKVGGGSCYAGICVTNSSTGIITGCDYSAIRTLTNNSNFAGICKENYGTVQGCALSAPADVEGPGNRGGIVYQNNGTVSDCYCNISYSNFTNNANWGGIVYQNNTGASHVVTNCYVSSTAILRSNGNVGGIVCINNGTVNYCRNESYALRGKEVGGIVATLSGGVVSNSYCNDPSLFLTLNQVAAVHSAGGIVAVQSGGTISNCFAVLRHLSLNSGDATGTYGAMVGRITSNAATVENCYAYEVDEGVPHFYGSNNGGTLNNCHLLGATQTDVDGITTVNHASLEALLTSLNTNKPSNGLTWTRGLTGGAESDTQMPYLVAPTTAKHSRTF